MKTCAVAIKIALFFPSLVERSCVHLAAAHITADQHTARCADRVRQRKGRSLCIVTE
jgi:hypothetical protein